MEVSFDHCYSVPIVHPNGASFEVTSSTVGYCKLTLIQEMLRLDGVSTTYEENEILEEIAPCLTMDEFPTEVQ
jgi:hypothetical protein